MILKQSMHYVSCMACFYLHSESFKEPVGNDDTRLQKHSVFLRDHAPIFSYCAFLYNIVRLGFGEYGDWRNV